MASWLDPIARALDARSQPVQLFVRNDDAGWEDERLFTLLDLFDEREFPIDLAVIPLASTERLAEQLIRRQDTAPLGLHQHGFAHANHELDGRKCEFGPSRSLAAQRSDILAGRERLLAQFGPALDSIFTPPWNRCTGDTATALREAGIAVLSRDLTAGRVGLAGLCECPIHIDWFGRLRGQRLEQYAWSAAFAAALTSAETPVGLMLHHAVMDDAEMAACGALLDLLASHSRLHPVLMREAAGVIAGRIM